MITCGNSSMTVVPEPHRKSFRDPNTRRTMASLIESPQVALVPVSKLASPLFSLSRLIVPVLCVSLGVSVGSAAGLTLALVNAPNDTVAASSDAAQRGSASAGAVTSVAMNTQPAAITQPAADTVDEECDADQIGRHLKDAAVEKAPGQAFRHDPSSQARHALVNRGLTAHRRNG